MPDNESAPVARPLSIPEENAGTQNDDHRVSIELAEIQPRDEHEDGETVSVADPGYSRATTPNLRQDVGIQYIKARAIFRTKVQVKARLSESVFEF
jgi:hypothetical protein